MSSAGVLGLLALSATACSGEASRLGMPEPISDQAERMLQLWQGSWIAAFAVGAVVWGLIIWAVLFHRKRSDDLPPQVRYNMPIEILYTAVPFVIIAVLFYFTARDEDYVEKLTKDPAVTVDVTGFQWSWKFDYVEKVGGQEKTVASVTGVPVAPNNPTGGKPVMTIPAGQKVRVRLHANDVIHSFWVPALLYKKDIMPGYLVNEFEFTANKQGTYEGRCAELCGVDHSRMLFQLRVVSPEQYKSFIDEAKAKAAGGAQ